MIKDTAKTEGMRHAMVEALKTSGITDEKVLGAMREVPRHAFLDSVFERFAYQDRAFEIGDGQTISRPGTVARQSELLEVFDLCTVLEVGTGSGYQACVLDKMGAVVYSIERQKNLYVKTKSLLAGLAGRVRCFYGDGYKGLPQFAPFDRILITCGAPSVPVDLLAQLKVGGIMVVPVGAGAEQVMTRIVRVSETEVERTEHGVFSFVPMLEKKV